MRALSDVAPIAIDPEDRLNLRHKAHSRISGTDHRSGLTVRARATPARPAARPEPGRVLVVDDDPLTTRLLELPLTRKGLTVGVATNASRALQLALELDPHVVLLDLHLAAGDIDGHALGAALRTQSQRPVQLVVVTSDCRFSASARTESLGFAAHLVKPVRLRDVTRIVDLLLPRANSGEVVRRVGAPSER